MPSHTLQGQVECGDGHTGSADENPLIPLKYIQNCTSYNTLLKGSTHTDLHKPFMKSIPIFLQASVINCVEC